MPDQIKQSVREKRISTDDKVLKADVDQLIPYSPIIAALMDAKPEE